MLSGAEISALLLSLKVALWAVGIGLPIAICTAFLLAKFSFRMKFLIDALLHIPLVVPPVVIGYLLLLALAPNTSFGGWLDTLGLNPAFKWQGAAIASGIMAFPLMVRSIRQAFEAEPIAYSEVAKTLSLSPIKIFWKIKSAPLNRNVA